MLFPALDDPDDRLALRFAERELTLRAAARRRGARGRPGGGRAARRRVGAVGARDGVAVIGALLAGVAAVPINPKAGERELGHIVDDTRPGDDPLRARRRAARRRWPQRPRIDVDLAARGGDLGPEPDEEAPALVVYTSGTTGPPKGAVLPRRAIASNLDALADAWEWTADDVVAHGLPLFHVHGLVIGVLGPIRRGGAAHHLGRFSSEGVAAALEAGRDDGLRRADDVPPPGRGRRGATPRSPARSAGRACSCRARPRCRPSSTSASSASAASASSSATG